MDHRCLYGHRVPVSFTFAIQNRTCPICGAPTVTVNGYQAARKLCVEAGLDAVAAFNAVRIVETDWMIVAPAALAAEPAAAAPMTLSPLSDDGAPAPRPAAPAAATPPAVDEEVVVDDETDVPTGAVVNVPAAVATVAPEPRVKPLVRNAKKEEARKEPEPPPAAVEEPKKGPGFDTAEEDFFKGA